MTEHTERHMTSGAHAHHHDPDRDWDAFAPLLEADATLDAPAHTQAADWLRERTGTVRRVLDVGSGVGVVACLLARTFPDAEVVAVDGTQALLDRVRARAERLGLADRVTTRLAELPHGLEAVGGADLIWTSKTVHHLPDQQAAVRDLARTLRPGGLLAIAEGGLPSRCLPRDVGSGRPDLQARLDVAMGERFAEMRAALPDTGQIVEDWPAMLTAAGLTDVASRTFLVDLPAPLDAATREALRTQLAHRREAAADRLDDGDLAALDRLVDPDNRAGLLHRPDVFLLSAQTFHTAVRAAG